MTLRGVQSDKEVTDKIRERDETRRGGLLKTQYELATAIVGNKIRSFYDGRNLTPGRAHRKKLWHLTSEK